MSDAPGARWLLPPIIVYVLVLFACAYGTWLEYEIVPNVVRDDATYYLGWAAAIVMWWAWSLATWAAVVRRHRLVAWIAIPRAIAALPVIVCFVLAGTLFFFASGFELAGGPSPDAPRNAAIVVLVATTGVLTEISVIVGCVRAVRASRAATLTLSRA